MPVTKTKKNTINNEEQKKNTIIKPFERISLPGFEEITFREVIQFFWRGLQKGSLSTRAASISFQFLLAAIPGLGFFLTLIPYIPIDHFQEGLNSMLVGIMPNAAYNTLQYAIEDVFTKRLGLQFFGFLTAMFFATNGISAVIKAFNATYHTIETRTWFEQKYISVFLVLILSILITAAIGLIVFTRSILELMLELGIIKRYLTFILLNFGKWIIVFTLIFLAISFLYYFAPSRKTKWSLFSPGSVMASMLTVLASIGFSLFINAFGRFDQLYGSIGTLMVILIWVNFNSIALLIGFELNASIANLHLRRTDQNYLHGNL